VEAVRQREVDQPVHACEREGRLRALVRERGEPPAFAAREHERENTRSLHLTAPLAMAFACCSPALPTSNQGVGRDAAGNKPLAHATLAEWRVLPSYLT
jgi:hypothetical protein